jgi:hypothetical protein
LLLAEGIERGVPEPEGVTVFGGGFGHGVV